MGSTPQHLLAWSSVSQMGFVIAAPQWAGLYGLAHGLAKPLLFVGTSVTHPWRWPMLLLGTASLAGVPGSLGYAAKALSLSALDPWHEWLLVGVTVGTTCLGVRVLRAPVSPMKGATTSATTWQDKVALVLWGGGLLWGWLPAAYGADNLLKALLSLGVGIPLGWFWERIPLKGGSVNEGLEAVVGGLSIVLVLVWALLAVGNYGTLP
ncbi:cation:proton antiporter, partial [Synechococcus sp. R3-13]